MRGADKTDGQSDDSPMIRISLLARLMRTRFDRRARMIGLTRAQWRTIACVRHEPGATQHRIATMLDVGDVTAGRSIDRLAESGWMERRPDPDDRRAYQIFLTEAASPVLERLSAISADEERIALQDFSDDERHQFIRMLGRISDNLSDMP